MTINKDFENFVGSNIDEKNEETMKEIPTENEIQVPIMNKIEDNFSSSFIEETIEKLQGRIFQKNFIVVFVT